MASTDLSLEHVSRGPERADGPSPAVVLLHGRGADEQDLLPMAQQLPDELHVLSVRAPDALRVGRTRDGDPSRAAGYTWYDLDLGRGGLHASQPDEADFQRSLDLVHEFVDRAVETYDLDADRIGLLGFSQGAILSLAALLERPGRYDWVVALNGYLAESHSGPGTIEGAAGKPVFVGRGKTDQIIPPERAKRAAETLLDGGLDVESRVYPVGHGTTPQEVRDVSGWIRSHL